MQLDDSGSSSASASPRSLITIVVPSTYLVGTTLRHACGCAFEPRGKSGGTIDASTCGYQARKNAAREVLEWEHVVPAYFFGHTRTCWKTGDAKCVRKDGKAYKGRECCAKVDVTFRLMEADLHNLTPGGGRAQR
jgi:deoxyribonuclease I